MNNDHELLESIATSLKNKNKLEALKMLWEADLISKEDYQKQLIQFLQNH